MSTTVEEAVNSLINDTQQDGWCCNRGASLTRVINDLLTSQKNEIREKIQELNTKHVPADNVWCGTEDYSEGEYKLVPAKDTKSYMYCLTCKRFLPEEGCLCGMVEIADILALLEDSK